jgi:4-phytase/acid phosphatase
MAQLITVETLLIKYAMRTRLLHRALLALLALCLSCGVAQPARASDTSALKAVVLLSRHGVRSSLSSAADLAPYAARAFPTWEVAPGLLTPHGYAVVTLMGRYYRALYAQQGLLPATGCPAAGSVYFWADTNQRTKETAQALADGLAPDCGLHDNFAATSDPLFNSLTLVRKADPATSMDALLGIVGGDPNALYGAYALPLARLEAMMGCEGGHCQRLLREKPAVIKMSSSSGLPYVSGGLSTAAAIVDTLTLAYADGKALDRIGWGSVTPQSLLDVSPLLNLSFQDNRGEPYASRVEGSNIVAHLLATIDQAGTGTRQELSVAPLGASFVGIVGHDTTLFELATTLRLSWLAPGYQIDATPPGGALAFEVRVPSDPTQPPFVRTYFMAATLQQMHDATPLTLANPPLRVPVFVPGCPALDCPLPIFDALVTASVDPRYVAP